MSQLTFTAQVVADLHATAEAGGHTELAGRLGAVLARLETVADPQVGQVRSGFGRERILDVVADVAAAATDDADDADDARPAAGWLRGVLAACGRDVDGPVVDLGADPSRYAPEPASPSQATLTATVHGDVDAPLAVAVALGLHAPALRLSSVDPAGQDDDGGQQLTVHVGGTGVVTVVQDVSIDEHVDVGGTLARVQVTAAS